MSAALLGDPASVLALAGALRRRSAELDQASTGLHEALAEARPGWVGPTSVRHRRRLDENVVLTGRSVALMIELADALEAFGTALAEARVTAREVAEQAAAAGLELVDGAVVERWGIRGEAQAAESLARGETAERLTRRVARATTLLERRRTTLARCAEKVTRTLL